MSARGPPFAIPCSGGRQVDDLVVQNDERRTPTVASRLAQVHDLCLLAVRPTIDFENPRIEVSVGLATALKAGAANGLAVFVDRSKQRTIVIDRLSRDVCFYRYR
jgi:hypothetical protein